MTLKNGGSLPTEGRAERANADKLMAIRHYRFEEIEGKA
jgi:hypothetical protein